MPLADTFSLVTITFPSQLLRGMDLLDASLSVVSSTDFRKRSKVMFWLPDKSATIELVKSSLSRQNPGLRKGNKGQTLFFSIKQNSFNGLKKNGLNAFLGLEKVTFQDLLREKPKDEGSDASQPT